MVKVIHIQTFNVQTSITSGISFISPVVIRHQMTDGDDDDDDEDDNNDDEDNDDKDNDDNDNDNDYLCSS